MKDPRSNNAVETTPETFVSQNFEFVGRRMLMDPNPFSWHLLPQLLF